MFVFAGKLSSRNPQKLYQNDLCKSRNPIELQFVRLFMQTIELIICNCSKVVEGSLQDEGCRK